MHNIKPFVTACYATVLCLFLTGCGDPNERLDEYVFYSGPQLKLKVVRFYRNIPFNYLGEHAVVMCQSQNTADHQADNALDAGWRVLGETGNQDSQDAQAVARRIQPEYQVIDERILVATRQVFNISFDACGHFAGWDPARLPPTMIHTVKHPDSCAPQGPVDCRYLDFEGKRAPRYEHLKVGGDKQVAFTVTSAGFKGVQFLRVHTLDNGNLWQVDAVSSDSPGLNPATIRSLAVPIADDNVEGTGLAEWLAALLPPRSMVIWPDLLTPCGGPAATDHQAPHCAAIQFNDSDGNRGELFFALPEGQDPATGKLAFHSGLYTTNGESRPVRSLRELPGVLAATHRR